MFKYIQELWDIADFIATGDIRRVQAKTRIVRVYLICA